MYGHFFLSGEKRRRLASWSQRQVQLRRALAGDQRWRRVLCRRSLSSKNSSQPLKKTSKSASKKSKFTRNVKKKASNFFSPLLFLFLFNFSVTKHWISEEFETVNFPLQVQLRYCQGRALRRPLRMDSIKAVKKKKKKLKIKQMAFIFSVF